MSTPSASGSMFGPPSAGNSPSSHAEKLEWFRNEFRPHFNTMVFGPINRLVISDDALIGFIFMACAIDYLAGFRLGASTKNKVQDTYIKFIDEYFPPDRYDSAGLSDSLRNGLVHMFTIKNKKYALTHNNPHLHLIIDRNGQTILNAANFRDDLVAASKHYFDDVEVKSDLLDKLLERYQRDGFLGVNSLDI
jgi:hypothetical protein